MMHENTELHLKMYCPACEDTTDVTIDLNQSVYDIMVQIEDNNFCHYCGGRCAGTTRVRLEDDNAVYDIPLWKRTY